MYLIRLFRVACHHSEQLVTGHTDIYHKSQFLFDAVFDLPCHLNQPSEQPTAYHYIDKCFIDTVLLHNVGIFVSAILLSGYHSRGTHYLPFTFLLSICHISLQILTSPRLSHSV